jgi:hypothetical protein
MSYRSPLFRIAALIACVVIPLTAVAANGVGRIGGGGATIDWFANASGYESIQLLVSMPNGDVVMREFKAGQPITLRLSDLGTNIEDGQYNYELRVVPRVTADVSKKLANARAANDEAAARKIMRDAGLEPVTQSGALTVLHGSFVNPTLVEGDANDNASWIRSGDSPIDSNPTPPSGKVAVNDQVIPDDLIVQQSLCVGFDCVNNESFGYDTIRLKENNTRIKFEDTSTGSYPTNDWQLTANDSASGGASKFSIEDITGSKVPVTVTAGASTNSIFIDSTGRVGFRTSTPVLDLHVTTSNTPAIRLEQTNSGGFTAQTWDIAGNEANFFVRDVTSGSRLPFRIRPGAPTSSVDISAGGLVGLGGVTSDIAPYTATAQVISSAEFGNFLRLYNSNSSFEMGGVWMPNTARTSGWLFGTANAGAGTLTFGTGADEDTALTDAKDTGDGISITTSGNVGLNCNAPTSDFVISATTNCSGSQSSINAGSTQFTASSSRTIKENLEPVAVPDLLDRIAKVDVYQYDFKTGPKNRLGMMAEDFHTIFGRGSDKLIDGNEVQMALWLAVQQLTEQNKQLQERLNALEHKEQ